MKLENVFYGFTKDGKRRILLRKFKTEMTTLGDVSRTMYFDLEKKEYIEPSKVDENSLVSINRLVGDYMRKSKRKVIKAYKADCNLLYDVTGAFFGNIIYKKRGMESLVMKNVLFARVADSMCRVQRVKNGNLYPWSDRVLEGLCVQEICPIKREQFNDVVVTKKKLLEADYRKEL